MSMPFSLIKDIFRNKSASDGIKNIPSLTSDHQLLGASESTHTSSDPDTSGSENKPATCTLSMVDGVRIVVPDSLDLITPYVLREQQDWFEDEIKFLRHLLQPGQKIIDIGANCGVYTLSMAKTVGPTGRVWAFEPTSSTANLLAEGIAVNGFTQVTLERSALSSASGTAQISLNHNSELNALIHDQMSMSASQTVPLVTLDDCMETYGWGDIEFMKIDAEGEESNILKGGMRFFSELSPLIQYEVIAGEDMNIELVQAFAALGYDSYRLVPGLNILVPFDGQSQADGFLLNLFCCKPDRSARLAAKGLLLDSAGLSIGRERIKVFFEKIKSSNAYNWRHTLANLAYGVLLAKFWEKTMSDGCNEDMNEALSFYAISRDSFLSPAERFCALEISFNRFRMLCERLPPQMRLASFARVARDYGARTLAANALKQLSNDIFQRNQMDLNEPFLAPGERFDSVPPGESFVNWILSSVLEEFERIGSFSSFYTDNSARKRLEIIRDLGLGSAEMQRRLSLLQQRFGLTAITHNVNEPNSQTALLNKSITYKTSGDEYFNQGRFADAAACYRQAFSINPSFAEAYNNLGNSLREQNLYGEAERSYKQAISIKPELANAYYNLGSLLLEQSRLNEAIENFNNALELKPEAEIIYLDLCYALFQSGQIETARKVVMNGIGLNPDFADFHYFLGNLYYHENELDKAIFSYRKALSIRSDFVGAHYNLGVAFQDQKRDEALACFQRVLDLKPDHYAAKASLLHQLQHRCEWGNLESNIQDVRQSLSRSLVTAKDPISPFAFMTLLGTTQQEQRLCAEKWVQSEYRHLDFLRKKLGFEFRRAPNAKIHIGYLSADFRQHPVSFLMAEVFEIHDRSRFKITAYSYGSDDGSAIRERLKMAFDDFVDIRDDNYEDAAKKIFADHVDILVDLTGYTQDTRSAILALRPAPIQVNYLGYPGTMGADFVDYLIADQFIIPPEQQEYYTEEVIWLPDCYMPNDRTRPLPVAPARKECGLPEDGIVFCCFNQTYKITPEMFDIWCRLLKSVPDSVLWLSASNPHAEGNLKREAENLEVEAKRLVMAPRLEMMEAHLARLQCADLFLDTIPFNAHTTCSDALWMGLPVITCVGDTFPSRVAGSLLTAIGVPELITYNLEDYYNLALDLAMHKKKRESIRNKIIANRDTAPLFDSKRFTRNLEAVYSQMMDEYAGSMHV